MNDMKPRELFETAVRVIGLILTLYGTGYLVEFAAVNIGYFTLQRTDVAYYLLQGIGYIVVGLYFLRGAPHFVRYAYPDEQDQPGSPAPPMPDEMEEEDSPEND